MGGARWGESGDTEADVVYDDGVIVAAERDPPFIVFVVVFPDGGTAAATTSGVRRTGAGRQVFLCGGNPLWLFAGVVFMLAASDRGGVLVGARPMGVRSERPPILSPKVLMTIFVAPPSLPPSFFFLLGTAAVVNAFPSSSAV